MPSRFAASVDFSSSDWLLVMDVLSLMVAPHLENVGGVAVIKSAGFEGLVRL